MSSTPLILPRQTPVNGSGRPYPSSTVTVYRAGTTTLATIYSNSARTVPLSNPLTSNSAGQFPPIYASPDYNVRIVLKTSAGVTLSDDDNIGTTPELTAAAVGAALYPFVDGEVGVTDYTYPYGDIRRYGAVGDGLTDDSGAFTNALDSADIVTVPDAPTSWKIGSTVSVPDGKSLIGGGLGAYITKGANGAIFSLGNNTVLRGLYLDGRGTTYTGVNITVPFTAEFEGYQLIEGCRIYDSASYGIQYVSGAAAAGFGSKVINCDLRTSSDTVECIQWGNDPTNSHGNRSVINCTAGSGALIDCNNADNGFIIGCTSGDGGGLASIKFGATSAKVICIGNRLAATTAITVQGQAHTLTGNVIAAALTLASGTSDCHIGNNVITGTVTDSSGESNQVDRSLGSYSGAWTGASSNPAIGDGTSYFFSVREGRNVTVYAGATMGSTTTYGSGAWRFSLPEPCSGSVNCIGSAIMYDSSATKYYSGVSLIGAGGTYLTIAPDEGTAGDVTASAPFTWASGDFIRTQITYPV